MRAATVTLGFQRFGMAGIMTTGRVTGLTQARLLKWTWSVRAMYTAPSP